MKDKQRSTSSVQDKHTPGPWRATKNGSIEHEGGILGEAYDFDSGYLGLKAEGLPMMANARLMAAAPELLNFAKDALGLLYGSIIFKDGKSQFDQSERDKLAAMLLRDGLEILTKIEGDE